LGLQRIARHGAVLEWQAFEECHRRSARAHLAAVRGPLRGEPGVAVSGPLRRRRAPAG
jgi:hypothetical protein